MLDECLAQHASLILVCGPAGYGKTTIVSDWLQTLTTAHPLHLAWLSLESGDDELTRFLTYLIAALRNIRPDVGEGVIKLLQTHKPAPVQTLGTLLVNDLSEIPGGFILVLDDFHLISSEKIHNIIAFLIEHQPPQMSLALLTRADPPLPLPRLRAKRRLVELRQSDLSFTPDEAAEFVSQVMGLSLSPEQLLLLEKSTEGWIAGLQLAALSMRQRQARLVFLETFTGEHKFIADYLTDEVLAQLPEALRTFLLQTSILERFTAPLCEAVTGQSGAQATLEQLTDANLFIIPLDSQQTWFRYHTLFADLLRKRLQDGMGDAVRELHRRASRWYRENRQIDSAIAHAIAGLDYEQAAGLIEPIAETYLKYGEAATLLGWLNVLPEETMQAHPVLAPLKGMALILCNKPPQEITPLLQMGADEFPGEVATLRALQAILQGKSVEAIQLAEQAMQQLPAQSDFFRSLAADSLGMAYTLAGNIEAATHAFQQVVEIATQSDNMMMALMALTNLAGLRYVQGQLRAAGAACQQVLEMAHQRIGKQTPLVGKTLLNLGEIVREQGDLDSALKYLLEAASMMEHFSEIGLPLAILSIARVQINQGDWPSAQSSIEKARRQAQSTQSTLMDDRLVDVMQARYWIARGELEPAIQWARRRGFLDQSPAEFLAAAGRNAAINEMLQAEYFAVIRLTLAQHQPRQALEMIAALQELIEKRGFQRRIIEILVLKAIAQHQNGDIEPAMQTLGKAFSLAEPEGYFRIFVDEGEPMARLLYQAVAQKISPVYAGRLLAVLSDETQRGKPAEKPLADKLIEPLSERELEVLGLIAQGLTNGEIASRLHLSLSTVKGHTTNIFGKLAVKNRTQAVARARSLGLIASDSLS
jgi:LuxR family maltose regulon positive regulatory protein